MPTLRRSKSLNDKIAKHKNRTGDVVRDPRTPEAEGRTRQCIDNFQALVHLRKQTEDKARQLELAISYASGGNTYIRRDLQGPAGGVELPYPPRKPSSAAATGGGGRSGGSIIVVRNPDASSKIPGPPPAVLRRQRSAERETRGAEGPGIRRRESLGQPAPPPPNPPLRPITQLRVRDSQRSSQRPLSMIEPRAVESSSSAGLGTTVVVAGGSLGERNSGTSGSSPSPAVAMQLIHPVQEELRRKDQVIQNLTESQKSLNAHNQQLLGKVDELEFLNHRLRNILEAHGVAHNEESFLKLQLQAAAAPHQPPCKPQRSQSLLCGGGGGSGETLAALPTSIAFSPVSSFKPALTSPLSPTSEASVSGYGSLASGDNNFHHTDPAGLVSTSGGTNNSGPLAGLPGGRVGDYDDDFLPLSDISREGSLDSNRGKRISVAEETGGGHSDRTDIESIHEKLDQVLELGKARESNKRRRIEELEEEVKALTSQRDTVVERFKLLVDEHVKQTVRDGRVHEAVERLLERHGTQLQEVVVKQLQQVQEQLWDVSREVARHIALVLLALAASPASSSASSLSSLSSSSARQPSGVPALKGSVDEQQVRGLVDKVVDLVGADYLRLGRYLGLTQPELERVEAACDSGPVKTRLLMHQWLQRRQREERRARREEASGATGASAVLDLALLSVDKDLRLFNHKPVSSPERQALANCLQYAIEHVSDPSLVLDHLITLNELTPSGIAFVREMSGSQQRAVARLWHVAEYRGTGVISRLALALQRAGYPHVASRLTDELEIENSKLHSHKSQPLNEELDFIDESPVAGTTVNVDATTTTTTTPSGPTPSAVVSRPSSLAVKAKPAASMLPRPRSKAAADRAPLPARKSSLHSSSSSASKSSTSSHSSTSSSTASSTAPVTKQPPTLGPYPDGRVGGEAANAALSPAARSLETPAVLQQPQQLQQHHQQQQPPQQTVWDRRLPSFTGVSPRGGAPSVPVKSGALLERGSKISRV